MPDSFEFFWLFIHPWLVPVVNKSVHLKEAARTPFDFDLNLQQDYLPCYWSEKVVEKLEKLLVRHLADTISSPVCRPLSKDNLFVLDDSKMYL